VPNIFDVLSGGAWLDLGSRLTEGEINQMAGIMSRTCPDCGGSGILGVVGIIMQEGIGMMPMPCELCEGTGEAFYLCHN
jgi:DnaJ-class molecular chaperone